MAHTDLTSVSPSKPTARTAPNDPAQFCEPDLIFAAMLSEWTYSFEAEQAPAEAAPEEQSAAVTVPLAATLPQIFAELGLVATPAEAAAVLLQEGDEAAANPIFAATSELPAAPVVSPGLRTLEPLLPAEARIAADGPATEAAKAQASVAQALIEATSATPKMPAALTKAVAELPDALLMAEIQPEASATHTAPARTGQAMEARELVTGGLGPKLEAAEPERWVAEPAARAAAAGDQPQKPVAERIELPPTAHVHTAEPLPVVREPATRMPLAAIPHVISRLASEPDQKAHSVKIRLDPPRLGEVSVELRVGENGVSVRIVSQTPEARNLLEQDLPRLQELLLAEGLDLASFSASCDLTGRRPTQQQPVGATPAIPAPLTGPPAALLAQPGLRRKFSTSVRINACA